MIAGSVILRGNEQMHFMSNVSAVMKISARALPERNQTVKNVMVFKLCAFLTEKPEDSHLVRNKLIISQAVIG